MGFNTECYSDEAYALSSDKPYRSHGQVPSSFTTEPIHTNSKGGKQSSIPTCYTCIPSSSIERVAIVFEHGRVKYGQDNHKLISRRDSIEHAIRHLYKFLEGSDTGEDDLSHAATRLLMALDTIHDGE